MAARPDITVETLVGLSDEIEAWTRTARRQEQDQEQGQTQEKGFGEQRRPPRRREMRRAAPGEGVKLADKVEALVGAMGWGALAAATGVRCFEPPWPGQSAANAPTVKSSLKFLRSPKHKWARDRVEALYDDAVLNNPDMGRE